MLSPTTRLFVERTREGAMPLAKKKMVSCALLALSGHDLGAR